MVSAIILTYNEEVNIGDCIRSLNWTAEVLVLDSGSTDATRQIAEELGAKVHIRPFTNYADQRRAALALPMVSEWVYMADADERVPPELAEEILWKIQEAPRETNMFRLRRKDMFLGKWMKRSTGYPTWAGRLFRKDEIRITREINEVFEAEGENGYLEEHFIHLPFNRGFEHWFYRHNQYSSMEARELLKERSEPMLWGALFSRSPAARRKELKKLSFKLPLRPVTTFLYLLIIRMGFIDGVRGFHYCCMRSIYEYMIDLKVKELRQRESGLSV